MENFDVLWQAVTQLKTVEGILPLDALEIPDPLGGLIRQLIRSGSVTLAELAVALHCDPDQTRRLGEVLVAKGYLTIDDQVCDGQLIYRVYIARMRKRNIRLDL